ncbi:MAG: 2-dehydro-3-deoxygalactonokinase [Bacteroidota bacterium]
MFQYDLFLSCDWGTSSFRLRLVEAQTLSILYELKASEGIKHLHTQYHSREDLPVNRSQFYLAFLMEKIKILQNKAGANLKHLPLVFSGMVSSSIGLKELPYGDLPFHFEKPELPSVWLQDQLDFPYKLLLISGIRNNNDVMRGEETQILGLSSLYNIENSLVILPGTHSKHVYTDERGIIDFKTYMTGEAFEIWSKHSVLSHSLKKVEKIPDFLAFRKGVDEGSRGNILHKLFNVRTNELLKGFSGHSNYYFLSGVLIGAELRELAEQKFRYIYLCGEGIIQDLYKEALSKLGYLGQLRVLDAEQLGSLVLRGHCMILSEVSQDFSISR